MSDSFPWPQEPFFTKQILTYLGNKRKLLPLIYESLLQSGADPKQTTFIDLFTGSGIVSRLAKKMGFQAIIANDWESYAGITQKLYLCENPQSIQELFIDKGGIEKVIDLLNHLDLESIKEPYISVYYAPKSLNHFDLNKERLFYTPENAKRIDIIRETIDHWYPSHTKLNGIQQREKDLLIALLLYKASVHTNTSGVFKAYYKDFGGYGHHALKRILSPLVLENPILIDGTTDVQVFSQDALLLAQNIVVNTPYSLAYLDPPYNIHQYGSNYHILNTIAQWDKPDMTLSYKPNGFLKDKAGIRKDWQLHKSTFCSKQFAIESFKEMIISLKVDIILVSYSIDGIIPFEIMVDILLSKGRVSITMNPYITYRGGKKSSQRKNNNIEFVLSVNTHLKPLPGNKESIIHLIEVQKNYHHLKGVYNLKILNTYFILDNEDYIWKQNSFIKVNLSSWGEFNAIIGLESLDEVSSKDLYLQLDLCLLKDKSTEIKQMLSLYKGLKQQDIAKYFMPSIFLKLKYLAYPKNQKDFITLYKKIYILTRDLEGKQKQSFIKKMQTLYDIFTKRLKK